MKRFAKRRPAKRKKSGEKKVRKPPEKQADISPSKHTGGKFKLGNTIGKEHYWKPGQSGNPKGKPKGIELTSSLKLLLNQPVSEVPFIQKQCELLGIEVDPKNKKIKVLDVLMAATITQTLAGKSDLMKQVWERIEGAVTKNIHLEGDPFDDYLSTMKNKTTFDQMKGKG